MPDTGNDTAVGPGVRCQFDLSTTLSNGGVILVTTATAASTPTTFARLTACKNL